MDAQPLIGRILDDEGLTGDLEGDDAERLVGWLIVRARQIAAKAKSEAAGQSDVEALCRRGREIAKLAAGQTDPKAVLESLLAKES